MGSDEDRDNDRDYDGESGSGCGQYGILSIRPHRFPPNHCPDRRLDRCRSILVPILVAILVESPASAAIMLSNPDSTPRLRGKGENYST